MGTEEIQRMNDPSYQFGYRLAELARLWRTELDHRLRPLGLSQARGIALLHLAKPGPPLTQDDLAERARIRGSTLARQLDLLEADGLIERREVAVPKEDADMAFDAATCIGCGACVAACKNSS